ncbi:Glycosyl transferase, group 1 [Arcticibacter svalbardensis MN12-7]|uniref:Glycosyl transferase, group 1 n=1 Tax=Arcticibacter svalbardensis MN12-7 TaxID=1150600 RepID=R9GU35_9SPHI|nr:glycosyltransferase family 4 protein [Arcticibacter svalbardensis]EOR95050.1 Glycosyl transferase, group 1 [Arcticibacter svalbardensis MN12-7]
MFKILITAPSLNENTNISGISSLTKTIITNNSAYQHYFHFIIGKKDSESKGLKWLLNQLSLLPRFVLFTLKHKIDIIHLNTDLTPFSILRDCSLLLTGKYLLRKKILLHIHGGYFLMRPPGKHSIFYYLIKCMLVNASCRAVLSEVEKDEIYKAYQIQCSVMPNAVKPCKEIEQKDFSKKLTFFFMGRMVRSKGIFQIAQCLSELTSYFNVLEIHIYGVGPDLEEFLKQLSSIKGLQYKYGGIVRDMKKIQVFQKSHIFLLPSLFGEGLPMAMLESMNYGCVPVVSNDASMGTVVKNGFNGYLTEKASHASLSENLIKVLTNRDELKELSTNAKQTIDRSYNLEHYINSLNQLYKTLIDNDESSKFFRDRVRPYHVR